MPCRRRGKSRAMSCSLTSPGSQRALCQLQVRPGRIRSARVNRALFAAPPYQPGTMRAPAGGRFTHAPKRRGRAAKSARAAPRRPGAAEFGPFPKQANKRRLSADRGGGRRRGGPQGPPDVPCHTRDAAEGLPGRPGGGRSLVCR